MPALSAGRSAWRNVAGSEYGGGMHVESAMVQNDSMKGERRMTKSTWSKLAPFAGTILFVAFGSQIAHQTGVEQWQMAGFVVGILMSAGAPILDLQSRVKELESKIAEIDAARISR
jgi:hypothetical protein